VLLSRCRGFLLILALAVAAPALSTTPKTGDTTAEEAAPAATPDPYGRESPRTFRLGLMDAMKARDYPRLARFLEIAEPDTPQATALARAFKHKLDEQGSLFTSLQISNLPEGAIDDGLPPDQERLGAFEQEGQSVEIIARRSDGADGPKVWRISAETLEHIPAEAPAAAAAKEEVHAGRLTIFGAPLGDWLILFGVGLLFYLLTTGVIHGMLLLVRAGLSPKHRERMESIVNAAAAPVALSVAYLAASRAAAALDADIVARSTFGILANSIGWFAFGWFVWRLVGASAELASARLRADDHLEGVGLVNFAARLTRILLGILVIAAALSSFGIDVTAGLAALGVGGLALALGARKLAENFIGSISVLLDRPVQVGDTCRIDGVVGVIDDIGMRSTRIRTRERTMLTIPNSRFSESEIENLTMRDRFLVDQSFGIALNAGTDRIELVLRTMRECLADCPHYVPWETPVRFRGFDEGCFAFQIYAQLKCATHREGYMLQEALLLDLLKRFAVLKIAITSTVQRFELVPEPAAEPV